MKKSFLLIALFSTVPAMADVIHLGQFTYSGSGCPEGTASAVLSPDQKTMSLLFDQYKAEVGGTTGRALDRKKCNFIIPIHVPEGISVSLFQVDFRGLNNLPTEARTTLTVDYSFADQGGPHYSKLFVGDLNQDYLVSNTLVPEAVVWSPCGKDVNLTVSSFLKVMTNPGQEGAMASVDSPNSKSGIIYYLQWRKCNK